MDYLLMYFAGLFSGIAIMFLVVFAAVRSGNRKSRSNRKRDFYGNKSKHGEYFKNNSVMPVNAESFHWNELNVRLHADSNEVKMVNDTVNRYSNKVIYLSEYKNYP